jgi:hypothetical protein
MEGPPARAESDLPYLIKEGHFYYLFVNRGFCCRGSNSSYYIRVPSAGWRIREISNRVSSPKTH